MSEPPAKKTKAAASTASLSIQEKYEILFHGNKHKLGHAAVARWYCQVKNPGAALHEDTVRGWRKQHTMEQWAALALKAGGDKRERSAKFPVLEAVLITWFQQVRGGRLQQHCS